MLVYGVVIAGLLISLIAGAQLTQAAQNGIPAKSCDGELMNPDGNGFISYPSGTVIYVGGVKSRCVNGIWVRCDSYTSAQQAVNGCSAVPIVATPVPTATPIGGSRR